MIWSGYNTPQKESDYENCVKVTLMLQCDPKLSKLKYGLYKAAMPGLTKTFYDNLTKFLDGL